jgi:7,8-dihydropterin-6-yl-methyl-4-(beta-D-ribofuranosyl)aminobenzene 5'-phosphate synthase
LFDRSVLITGEVDRATPFEQAFPIHQARRDGGWEPDALILDDQALIVSVAGKGPRRGYRLRPRRPSSHQHLPLRAAAHRAPRTSMPSWEASPRGRCSSPSSATPSTPFERLSPHVPVPAHCATGWKAAQAMAQRLPNAFIQNSVGTTLHLAAERAT